VSFFWVPECRGANKSAQLYVYFVGKTDDRAVIFNHFLTPDSSVGIWNLDIFIMSGVLYSSAAKYPCSLSHLVACSVVFLLFWYPSLPRVINSLIWH